MCVPSFTCQSSEQEVALERIAHLLKLFPDKFIKDKTMWVYNNNTSINLTKAMPPASSKIGAYLREEYDKQEAILSMITLETIHIPTLFARQVPISFAFMKTLPSSLTLYLKPKHLTSLLVDLHLTWFGQQTYRMQTYTNGTTNLTIKLYGF